MKIKKECSICDCCGDLMRITSGYWTDGKQTFCNHCYKVKRKMGTL